MTDDDTADAAFDTAGRGDCKAAEDVSRWSLFALGAAGDDDAAKELTQIRYLSSVECDDIDAATWILSMLTAESPYEDLGQTHREFIALIEDEAPIRTAAAFRYAADVRRRFRHWLNDFRSFDDRSSAWLSRTFGPDHPANGKFKQALSGEYDGNFAYRLATAMRNVSTHAGNTLNHQVWHVSTDADGSVVSLPVLAIDSAQLAEFPKLKPAVRDELRDLDGLLDARAVVDTCMVSCLRAHAVLTHALWEDIEPERELVSKLHEAAVAAGGQGAVFVDMSTFAPAIGRIDHRYNPAHLLEQADEIGRLAERLESMPASDVQAADLLLA